MAIRSVNIGGLLQSFGQLGQSNALVAQREFAERERRRQEEAQNRQALLTLAGAGIGAGIGGGLFGGAGGQALAGASLGAGAGGLAGGILGGQSSAATTTQGLGLALQGLQSFQQTERQALADAEKAENKQIVLKEKAEKIAQNNAINQTQLSQARSLIPALPQGKKPSEYTPAERQSAVDLQTLSKLEGALNSDPNKFNKALQGFIPKEQKEGVAFNVFDKQGVAERTFNTKKEGVAYINENLGKGLQLVQATGKVFIPSKPTDRREPRPRVGGPTVFEIGTSSQRQAENEFPKNTLGQRQATPSQIQTRASQIQEVQIQEQFDIMPEDDPRRTEFKNFIEKRKLQNTPKIRQAYLNAIENGQLTYDQVIQDIRSPQTRIANFSGLEKEFIELKAKQESSVVEAERLREKRLSLQSDITEKVQIESESNLKSDLRNLNEKFDKKTITEEENLERQTIRRELFRRRNTEDSQKRQAVDQKKVSKITSEIERLNTQIEKVPPRSRARLRKRLDALETQLAGLTENSLLQTTQL